MGSPVAPDCVCRVALTSRTFEGSPARQLPRTWLRLAKQPVARQWPARMDMQTGPRRLTSSPSGLPEGVRVWLNGVSGAVRPQSETRCSRSAQ